MSETALQEDFTYYRAQLAGQSPELTDKLPRCGAYRYRGEPIQIRLNKDDGNLYAWIGRNGSRRRVLADAGFAETQFSFFCRDVIPFKLYEAVAERNEPWPEDIESLDEARSNFPTDPFAALVAELELIEMKIGEFFKTPVEPGDDVRALQADKWKDRARKVRDELETMRKAEAKAFDDGKKAVQTKFVPVIGRADGLKDTVNAGLRAYQFDKDDRERAAKQARREAEIAAARKMGEDAPPERDEPRGRSRVATGSTTTVRRKVAVITDIKACAAFYAGFETPPRQLVDALTAMAYLNLKAGTAVPGAELREERSVR